MKRKEEQIANLKRRIAVFCGLDGTGRLDVNVDADQSHQLLNLLDSVVIKLEGGTDLDLQVLDEPTEEELAKANLGITLDEQPTTTTTLNSDQKPFILTEDSDEDKKDGGSKATADDAVAPPTEEELQKKAKEYLKAKPSDSATSGTTTEAAEPRTRKRSRSSSSSNSSSSSSSSDSESELPPPGAETNTNKKDVEPLPPGMVQEDTDDGDTPLVVSSNGGVSGATTSATPVTAASGENGDNGVVEVNEEPKPRALHKTASIFLRNLAPTITKTEVETVSSCDT